MPTNRDKRAISANNLPPSAYKQTNALVSRSKALRYLLAFLILATLLISSFAQADESMAERNARTKAKINLVIQEIYWRVKAQDYTVFWENELTYYQEENPIPKYIAQRQFTGAGHASGDSTISTFLDSVTIVADTAVAHLTTYVVSSQGDTGQVYTPQTMLYEAGRWKKAMSSTSLENDMYFDKIRIYREAADKESDGK